VVRIVLYRQRSDGWLGGFLALGHSGFAAAGEDIVCAAVSALTTVTVLGLQARLALDPEVEVDDERGLLRCTIEQSDVPSDVRVRAQDLLETMLLGLQEIASDYPEYVSVEEVAT